MYAYLMIFDLFYYYYCYYFDLHHKRKKTKKVCLIYSIYSKECKAIRDLATDPSLTEAWVDESPGSSQVAKKE